MSAGGFGKVYAGLLNGVQEVAVKVVTSNTKEQQRRFLREIALLKACLGPQHCAILGSLHTRSANHDGHGIHVWR